MKTESQLKSVSTEQQKLTITIGEYQANLAQTKDQLATVSVDRDRLSGKLAESQTLITSLRKTLEQTESTAGELRKDIDNLQAKLPESLGGNASLKSLQGPASKLAAELVQISRALRRAPNDRELIRQRDALAEDLSRQQLLIASARRADGVYKLQEEDTLSIVALRVYGDANHWPKIFQANTHILENPDQVVPEMALLTP